MARDFLEEAKKRGFITPESDPSLFEMKKESPQEMPIESTDMQGILGTQNPLTTSAFLTAKKLPQGILQMAFEKIPQLNMGADAFLKMQGSQNPLNRPEINQYFQEQLGKLNKQVNEEEQLMKRIGAESPWSYLAGSLMGYAPAGMLSRAQSLKGLASEGALLGGLEQVAEGEDRAWQAQKGAMAGFGGGALSRVAGNAMDAVKNYFEPYKVANELVEANFSLGKIPEGLFEKAKKMRERFIENVETPSWKKTEMLGKEYKNVKFDPENFIKEIDKELSKVRKGKKNNPENEEIYETVINKLEKMKKSNLSSWNNIVDKRQSFNSVFDLSDAPGKAMLNDVYGRLKKFLDNDAYKQMDKQGLSVLKDSWQKANRNTRERINLFDKNITASGNANKSKLRAFRESFDEEFSNANPDSFVYFMSPVSHLDGLSGMKHIAKIFGAGDEAVGKELAQTVLRPLVFSRANKKDRIDYKAFFNKFENLSNEQLKYIFGKDFDEINKAFHAYQKNPTAFHRENEAILDKIKDYFDPGIFGLPTRILGRIIMGSQRNEGLPRNVVNTLESDKLKAISELLSQQTPRTSYILTEAQTRE